MQRNEIITNAIETAKNKLEIARQQFEMITSAPCIENCNSICVFPETGLTIDRADDGRPFISNAILATQFTPGTAKKICENVKNGAGHSPVIMSPVQYYKLQIKLIERSIELFESFN